MTSMVELLRKFARENFGNDSYLPVLHSEMTTTKPMALVIEQARSVWKRPFSKKQIITLCELEKYVDSENKEAYVEDLKSKMIQEEVHEKGKRTPESCHTSIDGDVAGCAGGLLQKDDNTGYLLLGRLRQEYISEPDFCDILAYTVLDRNKMKRLQDEKLLLMTSVIYSERCELKGGRKQQRGACKPLFAGISGHNRGPEVLTRNEWGPILFKCCRVKYNKENSRLEIKKGEFAGKLSKDGR